MPNLDITRAEAAATLDTVKFKEQKIQEGQQSLSASDFEDLKGNIYAESIDYILKNGIMVGESEVYFNADGGLTRAQAAVMLERVLLKYVDSQ